MDSPCVPLSDLARAQILVERGEVCAVPTETVYGLAANAYDDGAVARIFIAKNRPSFNPLIVHYGCLEKIVEDVVWTPLAESLAQAFWPGPLTLVLERSAHSRLSPLISGGLSTVAVRVPSHPLFTSLLNQLAFPLAAPSANPSGRLSPTSAQHVKRAFPQLFVLEGGACQWGVESSVVDVRGPCPRLLREGAVTLEDLLPWAVDLPLLPSQNTQNQGAAQDQTVANVQGAAQGAGLFHSPGLLPAHYAPYTPLRLNAQHVEAGEGLLAFGEPLAYGGVCFNLSPAGDLTQAAARLFEGLHVLDSSGCTTIAAMTIPSIGLGRAVNDRLARAALGSPVLQKASHDHHS